MPTIFTHAMLPVVTAFGVARLRSHWRLALIAVACSVLPDADVAAFFADIPYASQWGHRGFTHSLFFALALALLVSLAAPVVKASRPYVIVTIFSATASHALLDAFTNGGLGVALWWPFSDVRIFMPWRPIEVSPIGAHGFFSGRGVVVLASELKCVWLPVFLASAALLSLRQAFGKSGVRVSISSNARVGGID